MADVQNVDVIPSLLPARLWNDDDKPFDYEINGARWTIPAKGFIEKNPNGAKLTRRECYNVRGFYPGKDVKVRLRVEEINDAAPAKDESKEREVIYICPVCGNEFKQKGMALACAARHKKKGEVDDAGTSTIAS